MKKRHAILSLVMLFAATMNTACNDNETKRVDVANQAVDVQPTELEAVMQAKSNLEESEEASIRARAALDDERDQRNDIQSAMSTETNNIMLSAMTSNFRESNAIVGGLEKEVILRESAVADKRAILNMALAKLTDEERAVLGDAAANAVSGDMVITEKDLAISRNTVGYEAAGARVDQLTVKIETATYSIEKMEEEIEWAVEGGMDREIAEGTYSEKIAMMRTQIGEDQKEILILQSIEEMALDNIATAVK